MIEPPLAADRLFIPVMNTGSAPEQYSTVVVVMVSVPMKSLRLIVNDAALEQPFALVTTTPIMSPSTIVRVTREVKSEFPDTAPEGTGMEAI